MTSGAPGRFGARLKALRETAGHTQEELATIAGLSVDAISALERGERRRPHADTVRALSAALDLTGAARDAFMRSARAPADITVGEGSNAPALPLPSTALVGRDADVQILRQWLADPSRRLITLTGPGGVGKTRLALEVAHTIAAEGASDARFVALAAIRAPAFVASAIGDALGLSNVTALDLPQRARAACTGHRMLLVLDNFEQVVDTAPLLTELLASVAIVQLLVTSRAPLCVRGEREYAVAPLGLDTDSDRVSPFDLAHMPAVRLFVERVRDVRSDFRLTPANGPTVRAICQRLDALPLALELAAPWMKSLTADELLRQLERDVLLSTVGPRDLPERQQTMNATVAWSYQLLDSHEQRMFRRLGVLPGRFPIEAAAAVLARPDDPVPAGVSALGTIAGLIDRSLLLRADTDASTRSLFLMLETVRAYATRQLDATGEYEDAQEGLARYCAEEAARAATGLVGLAQAEWLARVHDDLENYRRSLAWLIERGRAAEASGVASALLFFWLIRGHVPEGLKWYEQILSLPDLPPTAEARSLICAASMLYWQADHSRARSKARRGLELAQETADRAMVAQAEHLLGHVEYALGDIGAARERFRHGLRDFRAIELPWGIGLSLTGLAQLAVATGDAVEAEHLLDEAATVLRGAGPWFPVLSIYLRAMLAVRRSDADHTIATVRELLTRTGTLQDKTFVYSLAPLAAAAVLKGEHAWAARIFGAREAISMSTGLSVVDPSMVVQQQAAEREARAHLGPDRWAINYAAGHHVSVDTLLKEIDEVLQRRAAAKRDRSGRS